MPTKHYPMEPPGFGRMPFGDPSSSKMVKEFGRGFGSPTTKHKVDSAVGTTHTAESDVTTTHTPTDGS